jgi:hypothetical protein
MHLLLDTVRAYRRQYASASDRLAFDDAVERRALHPIGCKSETRDASRLKTMTTATTLHIIAGTARHTPQLAPQCPNRDPSRHT